MYFRRFTSACAMTFLWCFVSLGQSSSVGMSIDEVVRTALDANREYMAAKERVAEAQALVRQAGLRATPTIEVETATGAITGSRGESEYSAAYFHTFETSDKRNKRVAIAQIGLALAKAEARERQRQLASDVKMRFVASVSEQLKLASVRALLPVNEESYQLTVRRVDLGDAAPLEQQLLFPEMNRVKAQQTLLSAASAARALVELERAAGGNLP